MIKDLKIHPTYLGIAEGIVNSVEKTGSDVHSAAADYIKTKGIEINTDKVDRIVEAVNSINTLNHIKEGNAPEFELLDKKALANMLMVEQGPTMTDTQKVASSPEIIEDRFGLTNIKLASYNASDVEDYNMYIYAKREKLAHEEDALEQEAILHKAHQTKIAREIEQNRETLRVYFSDPYSPTVAKLADEDTESSYLTTRLIYDIGLQISDERALNKIAALVVDSPDIPVCPEIVKTFNNMVGRIGELADAR